MTNEPGDSDELQVSDLRPPDRRGPGAPLSRLGRLLRARTWRWGSLMVSFALLAALAFSFFPQRADLLRAIRAIGATPTPAVVSNIQISSDFVGPAPAATTTLLTPRAPPLGKAPPSCDPITPALTHVGPPDWGTAVGRSPVWLARVTGAYPTFRLGPAASAAAYSWSAPYTQYGWPSPIGLVTTSNFNQPVQLTGWNDSTGEAVSFGFIQAGIWGAPRYVAPAYILDPASQAIPAGGSDDTGAFWYGYAFFPRAGCYVISAFWQGGSWKATVSAGS